MGCGLETVAGGGAFGFGGGTADVIVVTAQRRCGQLLPERMFGAALLRDSYFVVVLV